jgi:hypothetical protein
MYIFDNIFKDKTKTLPLSEHEKVSWGLFVIVQDYTFARELC